MHKPTTSFNIKTTSGIIFHVVVGKGHVNFEIFYGFNDAPNLYNYKSWFFLPTKLVKKDQIVTFVNLTHHHSKQVDLKCFN